MELTFRSGGPPLLKRVVVATAIGLGSGGWAALRFIRVSWHPSDFGQAWFGALALRHGANPFALIGPGLQYDWPWRTSYPATAMVAALPYSFLPELAATFLFVAISSALLAFAVTADGWYRLPLFLSWPFAIAASSGQWSPLISAAACFPALAFILVAKPNIGAAVFISSRSGRLRRIALAGSLILGAFSLWLSPHWIMEWLRSAQTLSHIAAPITLLGGPIILVLVLRWRRPEARLILALACIPQTTYWYEAVPLLLVASSFSESLGLSAVSMLGFLLPPYLIKTDNQTEFFRQVGSCMILFNYLPAAFLVLKRPNVGDVPEWAERGISQFTNLRKRRFARL